MGLIPVFSNSHPHSEWIECLYGCKIVEIPTKLIRPVRTTMTNKDGWKTLRAFGYHQSSAPGGLVIQPGAREGHPRFEGGDFDNSDPGIH